MVSTSVPGLLVVYETWVTQVCLLLDNALWAEVGGGITFVTSGENASQSIKLSASCLGFMWDS